MKSDAAKFALRLLWARATGKAYPLLVQFTVTNRCNGRCRYCYAKYFDRSRDDMPLEQVREVIDALARAGAFRLNLVGGEPLLRNDLGAIVDHVEASGLRCAMTTNGLLVPQHMDVVRRLGLVCFSLDGRQEGNDAGRGQGAYAGAVAGMDACRAEGIPMQLSAVLTRHTVSDVDVLVDLASEYGCKVAFTPLIAQKGDSSSDDHDLHPDDAQLRQALAKILELKRSGRPILFSSASYEHALNWPDYRCDQIRGTPPEFTFPRCYAGRFFCIIDYNGDIYPCPQLVGAVEAGNILRHGFAHAFRQAGSHNCYACCLPCSNEFSMFFGLRPGVVLDQLRSWRH